MRKKIQSVIFQNINLQHTITSTNNDNEITEEGRKRAVFFFFIKNANDALFVDK